MVDNIYSRRDEAWQRIQEQRGREDGEDAAAAIGSAPSGYRLNTCDPEVLLLLRADGTRVAAFSARGATATSIRNAAEDDRGAN